MIKDIQDNNHSINKRETSRGQCQSQADGHPAVTDSHAGGDVCVGGWVLIGRNNIALFISPAVERQVSDRAHAGNVKDLSGLYHLSNLDVRLCLS